MTRRILTFLPLSLFLKGEDDVADRFFDPCREWIHQINARLGRNDPGLVVDRKEIELYLRVREAWPRLKRVADRFYGV